jgi:3-methyladenine DNA glycosylase AlkD
LKIQYVLDKLKRHANPHNVAGMARFGINPKNTYGIGIPVLRAMAKEIGVDHTIAIALWQSGIHEARILAGMVDDPATVTRQQMEQWARDLDSWDVCDQVCMNLFRKTEYAYQMARAWSTREEEFVKRAGFTLMATLAVNDKKVPDEAFRQFLAVIKNNAHDERNYVKKAVNWALRQIGKRNKSLNKLSIKEAENIMRINAKSARWIAKDALRELKSEAVQKRLKEVLCKKRK